MGTQPNSCCIWNPCSLFQILKPSLQDHDMWPGSVAQDIYRDTPPRSLDLSPASCWPGRIRSGAGMCPISCLMSQGRSGQLQMHNGWLLPHIPVNSRTLQTCGMSCPLSKALEGFRSPWDPPADFLLKLRSDVNSGILFCNLLTGVAYEHVRVQVSLSQDDIGALTKNNFKHHNKILKASTAT